MLTPAEALDGLIGEKVKNAGVPKRYFREWILWKGIDFGKLNLLKSPEEIAKLRQQWMEESGIAEKDLSRDYRKDVQSVRRDGQLIVEGAPPAPLESKAPPSADRPTPQQESKKQKDVRSASSLPDDARLCVDCGVAISPERVKAVPSVTRCIKCQSTFEGTHDTRPHINEGLPGTRDGHKKMRGQLLGDMRNRGPGR